MYIYIYIYDAIIMIYYFVRGLRRAHSPPVQWVGFAYARSAKHGFMHNKWYIAT